MLHFGARAPPVALEDVRHHGVLVALIPAIYPLNGRCRVENPRGLHVLRLMVLVLGSHPLDLEVALVVVVFALLHAPEEAAALDGAARVLLGCFALGPGLAEAVAVIAHYLVDKVSTGVNRSLLGPLPRHHAEEVRVDLY